MRPIDWQRRTKAVQVFCKKSLTILVIGKQAGDSYGDQDTEVQTSN